VVITMYTNLFEIELRGGFNRQEEATRHGHTVRQFTIHQPGRIGAFFVAADGSRPQLHWRSTGR
jgi:hypothetical protein